MEPTRSYKFPIVLAVALHLLLFGALFLHFVEPAIVSGSQQVKIVQASLVDSSVINKAIEQKKQAAQRREQQAEQRAKQLAAAKTKQAEMAAQKAAAAKAAQVAAEQQKLLAQQQATEKVAAQKAAATEAAKAAKLQAQQQAVAKKATAAKQKQLAAQELKALQQKMMQQQLAKEQKQLSSAAAASAQQQKIQSELGKYFAAIQQAIEQNWIVPPGEQNLKCQVLIQLGTGGVVVNAQVTQSSGDPVFDRSVVAAVFKASPLPVPTDPQLFDKFRKFQLTADPKKMSQPAGD